MIELTNEERRILTEVYNYQDPDTTLAGSNTEEKREILNLISVLRETPGGAGVKIRPFGNGDIAKAEALALAKAET